MTATVIAVQQRIGWTQAEQDLVDIRAELASTHAQLASTETDLETMVADRDQLTSELEALQDEHASLDARLEEAAGEKALAQDEREVLRQVLSIAPSVTSSMALCADANETVSFALLNYMSAYPYGSELMIETAIDNSNSICDEAATFAAELDAIVAGLT